MNPGIYPDFDIDLYHSDAATPEIALSHSGIVTLLTETPAHFAARNPRLTSWPDLVEQTTKEQDLGAAIHKLILGRGSELYVVSGFDDWKKKEAQIAKKTAREEGYVPLLEKTFMQASAVAERAITKLTERFGGWPIGDSEVAMFWKRQTLHGEIWGRALCDIYSPRTRTILDVKTTSRSIGDEDLAKKFAGDGADIQAAWYVSGAEVLVPEGAGLWQFMDCVVEVEPPYSVRFARFSEAWLTRARYRIDRAANLFAECMQKDAWPAWTSDATLQAPGHLETRWTNEELEAAS